MKLGVKSYRWINLSSVKLKSPSKRQNDLHQSEKAFSSAVTGDIGPHGEKPRGPRLRSPASQPT